MELSKETIQYLDSLDDELFMAEMCIRYGAVEPIWEECSQEEYEKYNGVAGDMTFTLDQLRRFEDNLANNRIYEARPVYKDAKPGLMSQLELFYKKPDSYRYYRKIGEKYVFYLGASMLAYCSTRECMKPFMNQAE